MADYEFDFADGGFVEEANVAHSISDFFGCVSMFTLCQTIPRI